MSGRTIHEVPLVSEVKGGMKIPISDGGNLPQTASVEQINKFISDQIRIYVNDLLKRYVEKIDGKGLSTNDFTNTLKSKLDSLSNYDDTQIVSNIAKLQNVLDTLVSGDISSKIESFNEIISFLENVEDSESFEGIVSGITNSIKGIEVKLTELGSEVGITFNEWRFKDKYYTNYSVGNTIELEPKGNASSYNSFCYYLGTNDKAIIKGIQAGGDTLYVYIVDAETNVVLKRLNEEGSVEIKSYEFVADKPCYILGSSFNKGVLILNTANAITEIREQVKSNEEQIINIGGYEAMQAEYTTGMALLPTGDLSGGGYWGTYYEIPMSIGDKLTIEGVAWDRLPEGYSYIRITNTKGELIYVVRSNGDNYLPSMEYVCLENCLISVCLPEQDKDGVKFLKLKSDTIIGEQCRNIYERIKENSDLIQKTQVIDFSEWRFKDKYYTNYSVGNTIELEPKGNASSYNSFCYYLSTNDKAIIKGIQAGADTLYVYIVDAETNVIRKRLNEEGSVEIKSYEYVADKPCYILGSSFGKGSVIVTNANAPSDFNVSINRISGSSDKPIEDYFNKGKALISNGELGMGGDWNTYYQVPLKKGDRIVVSGGLGGILAEGYSYVLIKNEYGVLLYAVHADGISKQPNVDYICAEHCQVSVCTTAKDSVRCYSLNDNTYLNKLFQASNRKNINLNEFSAFLKFGVIGDSLSVGYMTNPITGVVNGRNIPYSWGQVLARKLGTECLNFGSSGVTAKTWMIDSECYQKLIGNENDVCECYIVGLGVNDNDTIIGNMSDINWDNADSNGDTFYGNYGKVLQKVHEFAPNAIIFALTIPHTHIDAGLRNKAIREIVATNNIEPCILVDLKEDYYDIFSTDIEQHYYNWHYSAVGYAAIADVMLVALSEAIRNNVGNKYIGSIGFPL